MLDRSDLILVRRAVSAIAVGFAFFALAVISVLYSRFEGGPAFLWGATGVALGVLLVSPVRTWAEKLFACGIASFLTTAFFSLGPVPGIMLAFVNVSEILIAALLLRHIRPSFGSLRSPGEIVALICMAGMAAPALSAIGGAAVISAYTPTDFWPDWLTWFSGHALGTMIVCPFVILLMRGEFGRWWRENSSTSKLEAIGLVVAMGAIATMVFSLTSHPLLVLPFPLMMAAVFRHGRIGAILAVLVLAIISVTLTTAGWGPIGTLAESEATRSILLQLYLAAAVLTVLPAAGDLGRMEGQLTHFQEQSALYKLILDCSGDLILTFDDKGIIRFASPSASDVIGIAPEKLVGAMPQTFIHPDDIDRVVAVHMEVFADPSQTRTVDYRICVDGRLVGWFETHAQATVDDRGRATGTVCVVRNVSERKSIERTLSNAARTDSLTGLANRRAFEEAMDARLSGDRRAGSCVVALFDLDRFKSVNDLHGHAAGDEVLKVFAAVTQKQLRSRDLAARIGGEEFAVVIEGDLSTGMLVCDRIREAIGRTVITVNDGERIGVTVSGGLCPIPRAAALSDILRLADAALYQAKRKGRNRVEIAASPLSLQTAGLKDRRAAA